MMALRVVLAAVGGVLIVLAVCFRRLTVRGEADRLVIAFGPVPLVRKSVLYSDIEQVEWGRTAVISSWGAHFLPGQGWTYSLWGFGGVVLRLAGGGTLRVGTDDPE